MAFLNISNLLPLENPSGSLQSTSRGLLAFVGLYNTNDILKKRHILPNVLMSKYHRSPPFLLNFALKLDNDTSCKRHFKHPENISMMVTHDSTLHVPLHYPNKKGDTTM
jgi:hypothetical protein